MTETNVDMRTLAEAFELFNQTTRSLEESYRLLEQRVRELDQELAAKNRELAFTSDYLNYILESMSDGVIAIDSEGIVTAFNRAAGEVLGYSPEEAVGNPFQQVFGREFSAESGRARIIELTAKSGKRVPVSENDSPLHDRTGRRIGTVKVFHDLSEVEALREQVRRKDRLAAIGEMAATVAHEIRNPLGGIRGFAALLARDFDDLDPRKRLVEKILTGTRNLDRVVTELLEYTRPVELRLRSTLCSDLIEAAVGYLELGNRAVSINNRVGADVCALADPDKLRQVLLNILINSVQSIEQCGLIEITASTDKDAITILVRDTGCGMSREHLEQVFSPFFTTKEKGTGLGLAVAAKIVEGHGGWLKAESELGKGTTMMVCLPRAD
ncbi:MAG: PAS domain S-box protein [Candidatus Hydrogenedentes bacterium]|nr:PAS domain S-box protein [Candidatus Hydrogenedentota bacterium]